MAVVDTYTIGEAAERSGFSASALRYYEGIGLLAPSTRTDTGYRLYDDHDLARLSFIRRAKQLGCSLEEITDLVDIWDGERCGPVQHRFHDLVTSKIADAEQQILELNMLTAQLRTAAAQLARPVTDGACGEGCACLVDTSPAVGESLPLALTAKPDEIPIACTLNDQAIPSRLDEWRATLDRATSRTARSNGVLRLEFSPDLPLGDLANLVAAEQHCCAFFSFAITIDHRGVGLEVHAASGSEQLAADLFGPVAA